jgi:hypothetical protein
MNCLLLKDLDFFSGNNESAGPRSWLINYEYGLGAFTYLGI